MAPRPPCDAHAVVQNASLSVQSIELHVSIAAPSLQWQRTKVGPVPAGIQVPLLWQLPLQQLLPLVQGPPVDWHGEQEPEILVSQMPLQHSVLAVQEAPFGRPEQVVVDVEVVLVDVEVVGVWQVPLTQTRLPQHCGSLVQFLPRRLHPGGSADASPMPSDPSVPPTRAAPINLRALPRVRLPSASPLARSSKKPSSLAIGRASSPERAELVSPAVLYNATTLARNATRRTPK
jgi:hypothetical protein